jgi:hypothetical protein
MLHSPKHTTTRCVWSSEHTNESMSLAAPGTATGTRPRLSSISGLAAGLDHTGAGVRRELTGSGDLGWRRSGWHYDRLVWSRLARAVCGVGIRQGCRHQAGL